MKRDRTGVRFARRYDDVNRTVDARRDQRRWDYVDGAIRYVMTVAFLFITFVLFLHAGLEWPGQQSLDDLIGGLVFGVLAILAAPE